MKNIFLLSVFLISQNAFSFETGRYHGELDKQVCDIDLTQKESGIVINHIDCVDSELGLESHQEAMEFDNGHSEEYVNGWLQVTDVSDSSYSFVSSHIRTGDVVREKLETTKDGKIHYSLSVNYMTNIFNLDLAK